eukprot:SAG31_NODE_5228_length_2662_cov_1.697620_6_plen_125_part_00
MRATGEVTTHASPIVGAQEENSDARERPARKGQHSASAGAIQVITHDEKINLAREELNDGIHLVTAHYVLSPDTDDREKIAWIGLSWGLLLMQMVAAAAIMAGAVVPNCTSNSHCREGQYCCPR